MTLETTIDTAGNIVTAGSATVDTTPTSPESVNVYDNGEVTINSSDPLGTDTEAFASFTSDGWTLLAANCTGTVSTLKNTLDDGSGNATFQGAVTAERFIPKNGSIHNALDYGAVANGSTDNTSALQNMLDAAKGNGIAYIPAQSGTYVTSQLNIASNTHLILDGTLEAIAGTNIVLSIGGGISSIVIEGIGGINCANNANNTSEDGTAGGYDLSGIGTGSIVGNMSHNDSGFGFNLGDSSQDFMFSSNIAQGTIYGVTGGPNNSCMFIGNFVPGSNYDTSGVNCITADFNLGL